MAMIPYMAAGYAVDRAMGGNGLTGLGIGTGVGGFGTGAFSGALGTGAAGTTGAAGSTSMMMHPTLTSGVGTGVGTGIGGAGMTSIGANTPMGLSNATQFGSVNPLTTGGFSESISPFTPQGSEFGLAGSENLFGSPISNQTVNSALTQDKGLLNRAIEDSYIQDGFDFINEGYEGMSLMDKINTGVTGNAVIDNMTADRTIPIQGPPPQTVAAKEPTIGSPVSINVQAPNRTFVKDPRKLYEETMYG